ncbi:MAG: ABC transporter ATP-binding protein/permease, partial [Clostridiales bacterium]|nr:ABC transporter ATP-binding protein/permease [Clostridiales bacterium]
MTASKPKYSVFSNIGYSLYSIWLEDKSLSFWLFAATIIRIIMPFTGILTPRIVIDEILAGAAPERFFLVMGVLGGALFVLNFFNGYSEKKISPYDSLINHTGEAVFKIAHVKKMLTMDFANRDNPEFVHIAAKAERNMAVWASDRPGTAGIAGLVRTVSGITINIGGLILFGGVIALVHPLIIVLLCISVAINSRLQSWHRKFDEERREKVTEISKKFWHIGWLVGEKQFAKDMRVFSMKNWLLERWNFHLSERRVSEVESSKRGMVVGLVDSLMVLIRDGAAYAFLTYLLLANQIGLGEFVMVFGAIGGMAGWINGILYESNNLFRSSVQVNDCREMLNYPDISRSDKGVPVSKNAPEIHLKDVSYTYPGAEKPTLKNINLKIKPGERLAIVGVNGAGKTTLIKLICGFYRPTIGNVFYNNYDIGEYNREEYFSAITAVFQNINIMPTSITENVSQCVSEKTDTEKVRQCLIKAGLWEKVKSLEKGSNTVLVHEVSEDAIDLSGGERQKLALARALYKDAPLMILDEPSAALDPIAESEMYRQYASLTKGKTSVYISHRLASTRFCDRILFIDNMTITEEG